MIDNFAELIIKHNSQVVEEVMKLYPNLEDMSEEEMRLGIYEAMERAMGIVNEHNSDRQ